MSLPIVLVTEREFQRAELVFTTAVGVRCVPTPGEEGALSDAIADSGAQFTIVGGLPYRDGLYAALPRGGVIARFGVGYDNIDREKATAAGIVCTNTPGTLDQSVAEQTMAFVAAAARRLLVMDGRMKQHVWEHVQGVELSGRTLAIVGCGKIGGAVARIAHAGFGMRVVGYRRSSGSGRPVEAAEMYAEVTDDYGRAVGEADFVSLHIPSTPANARFIDAARLAVMRPDAWLVNTARGAVVDEAALYDALASDRLAGAALDVFEREPYEPVDAARDLRALPNVILQPHVGSHTVEANRRMGERALRNISLAMAGEWAQMDKIN
jgi:phosphoglycerate dehydrogenase-like enzyme